MLHECLSNVQSFVILESLFCPLGFFINVYTTLVFTFNGQTALVCLTSQKAAFCKNVEAELEKKEYINWLLKDFSLHT